MIVQEDDEEEKILMKEQIRKEEYTKIVKQMQSQLDMKINEAQLKTTKLVVKRLTKDLETVFLRSVDVKIETPQQFIIEIKKEIERLRAFEAIVCRGREYA